MIFHLRKNKSSLITKSNKKLEINQSLGKDIQAFYFNIMTKEEAQKLEPFDVVVSNLGYGTE